MASPTVYARSYNTDRHSATVLRRLAACARADGPYASAYRMRLHGVPTVVVVILTPPDEELARGVQHALRGGWAIELQDDLREHFIARSRAARAVEATSWIQYALPLPQEPGDPWPVSPDGQSLE